MIINPNAASFLVTENCNLACTYCFELSLRNRKTMSKETARKAIDFLAENAIKDKQNHFQVLLFGGEPWLVPEICEEILSYGCEVAEKKNLNFNASIITNATLLSDEIKRIYKKYIPKCSFATQLSVDGVEKVQDMYRIDHAGKGSFHLVEKNIKDWQELYKDHPGLLSIHGCSNRETLGYLYENFLFFRETWGFERIWFMPIHSESWTNEDVKIYDEQLGMIYDWILKETKRIGHAQEVLNYAPIDRCFGNDEFPSAPCGAGKNFITVTADGLLSPCHQFYFNDPEQHTLIGSLETGIDEQRRKMFLDYDNKDMSCSIEKPDCECFGCYRCIADNWIATGSFLTQIRGPRCSMSHVERKYQLMIREELRKMGIRDGMGNNNNGNCKCDVREGGDACKCDVRESENCACNGRDSGDACKCNARGYAVNLDSNKFGNHIRENGPDGKCGCDEPFEAKLCGGDCGCGHGKEESFKMAVLDETSSERDDLFADSLRYIMEKIDAIDKKIEYQNNLLEVIAKKVL